MWDERFLELAEQIASWSKDPSSRVGAVIVRPDRTIASVGYNGFPRGVLDYEARLNDREIKNMMTVHAEMNALMNAHERLDGCLLYVTHPPCASCAAAIIQAGIKQVGYKKPSEDFLARWGENIRWAETLFAEAGVTVSRYNPVVFPSQASDESLLGTLCGSLGRPY